MCEIEGLGRRGIFPKGTSLWQGLEAGENRAILSSWERFSMTGEMENGNLRRKLEPDPKRSYGL